MPRELSSATETRTDASKKSAQKRRKIDANTAKKASIFDASSQSVSEVASEPQKVALGGARAVPGGAREVPESSPSPPGASPGRLRSTPGARPERPTRATGHRRPRNVALGPPKAHSAGPRDLILELPGPIFRATFPTLRHPRNPAAAPPPQKPRGVCQDLSWCPISPRKKPRKLAFSTPTNDEYAHVIQVSECRQGPP